MKKMVIMVGVFLVFAVPSQATVIFDGGDPNHYNSFDVQNYRVADDFSFPVDSIVTDVHFWTHELDSGWDETLDYYIYADNSGPRCVTCFRIRTEHRQDGNRIYLLLEHRCQRIRVFVLY